MLKNYSGAKIVKKNTPPLPPQKKTNNTYESHNPCIMREVIQTQSLSGNFK